MVVAPSAGNGAKAVAAANTDAGAGAVNGGRGVTIMGATAAALRAPLAPRLGARVDTTVTVGTTVGAEEALPARVVLEVEARVGARDGYVVGAAV